MAELNDMKKALKGLIDQYDNIEIIAKGEGRDLNDAESKSQQDIFSRASVLREKIDAAKKMEDLKNWGNQSEGSVVGSSVVQAGFDRTALPGEGALKGVDVDRDTGEMAAKSFHGEGLLKTLKSGAYLDGLLDMIRCRGLAREGSMKASSMKVMNEAGFTSGEAWLQPDFRNQLIQRTAGPSSVRKNASVYSTGTDIITFPQVVYNGATDDTNGDLYTSGSRGVWRASAALSSDPAEATNPVAGNIRIPVHVYTLPIITTREQLEDNSFDLLGWITKNVTENAMLDQEQAYTTGNGDGRPVGFANHPTFTSPYGTPVTVAGKQYTGGYIPSGLAAALTWPLPSDSLDPAAYGLLGMEAAMAPQYEDGAKFYASKRTYAGVRGLADANGRPLWQQSDGVFANYVKGYPPTLLGYGIEKNQFLPNVAANTLPAYLGDLKSYYIVDRIGVTVEVFNQTLAIRDQVLIYLRMRTGGALVDYYKMRALKIATS